MLRVCRQLCHVHPNPYNSLYPVEHKRTNCGRFETLQLGPDAGPNKVAEEQSVRFQKLFCISAPDHLKMLKYPHQL